MFLVGPFGSVEGGGGSMVVYGCWLLDNMPPERPLVEFRIFDARQGKYVNC